MFGVYLAERAIQYNNLNGLFTSHDQKWAFLFLWNRFGWRIDDKENKMFLGIHQLRTTAPQCCIVASFAL